MQAIQKLGVVPFSHYFNKRMTIPFFRGVFKMSADYMNNSGFIDYFFALFQYK